MIRLAPLITADVDTTTLPGGKASDAAQDFLALLSEALAGETTTDKAAPQLLVATDKPTTKGEPLVSEILADAQQADLLIPVDETPPVINDEQSTSTPLTTAQTMTLAAVAGNNTAKDEKADDLNEDVTASLSALFAMLPGFDNTPKVTDVPSTVLPAEKPTLFTKLTSAQLTTAQPDDASGIAAVVVATVPLFTLCFSRLFGIKTRKLEWVGIAIGLAGIIMLNSGGNLSGNPWGAILILIGSISWAFGSVYGSRITLPVGMMAGAIEMLAAGVVLMIASMIAGEKLTALPSLSGFLAVGYLALFGSIIAINAYMYLIRNVSPALATSYAYVNPVVAVLLGTGLGGETLSKIEWLALGVIVFAVVLVTLGKYLFPAKPVVTPVIQDASSE